jgi:formate hydrogenlyase transcriptional activator
MDREVLVHLLGERVKELTALHDAARLLDQPIVGVDELLDRIVALIPPAWQFPEITEGRARYGSTVRTTPGFAETPWMQSATFATSDGVEGCLDVVYLEERPAAAEGPFLLEERHLVASLADMLRSALEWRVARSELRRSDNRLAGALTTAEKQRDRVRLLLDLSNAIASELDLDKLVHAISELLRSTVDHHYINLSLWDAAAGGLRRRGLVFPEGRGLLQDGELVKEDALPSLCFAEGVTKVWRMADIEALGGSPLEIMRAEGLRCACCVPLHTPRARLGTLNVGRLDDHAYSEDEIALLEQIAMQIAIPIENAQHFDQARRFEQEASAQRDRLRVLLDVANTLSSERELMPLVRKFSMLLHEKLPYAFAGVSFWDEDVGRLRRHVVLYSGRLAATVEGGLVPAGYPASIVWARGETMVFRQSNPAGMSAEAVQETLDAGLRSGCGVMLETARARHGVLMVGVPEDRPFEPAEIQLLEQIGRQFAIAIDNARAYQEISDLKERLAEEKLYLEDEIEGRGDFRGIIGSSQALTSVLHAVRTVAPTDATVLLLGETGTGKEVVARAIHDASRRQRQTFVRVNTAALPAALAESELFGYEKGAFTGAVASKVGRLELAHRGSLFLDEIGDMPIDIQPKLLRVLQENEFERLGSTRTQRVDVRLIAATNRDLEAMVAAGTFRSDLYYRLSVFPILLPPLRERPEDIPPLVRHFVQKFSTEMGRTVTAIPTVTMQSLQNWSWPGNIRELQNVIERAVILSTGSSLQLPPGALRASTTSTAKAAVSAEAPSSALSDAEREAILTALREAGGVVGGAQGAAARLGVKRTTLHSKMRKLGIHRPAF